MKRIVFLFVILIVVTSNFNAQKKERHQFTIVKKVKTTPVKDQGKSGTCWDFATTSFVETELLRKGKGEYDLSEAFVIYHKTLEQAREYVRYHGTINFGSGGQAHDWFNVFRNYGALPDTIMNGKIVDTTRYDLFEFDAVVKNFLDGVISAEHPSSVWDKAVEKICETYLGEIPNKFEYDGKEYSAKSFGEALEINPDDYIEITSYTHHPFYEKFPLEIPDNWARAKYYNVPLDDLVRIMDYALNNGYSVLWDGDVGSDNFYKEGYAVVPIKDYPDSSKSPEEEKTITQEMRQRQFDNYSVTDDHLMHIVGVAKDQAGKTFYYVKNSWGVKRKDGKEQGYEGYWYFSVPYVKLKTIAIAVHKDAIPKDIRTKLKLKD
jgi:bleomycin hydrolase